MQRSREGRYMKGQEYGAYPPQSSYMPEGQYYPGPRAVRSYYPQTRPGQFYGTSTTAGERYVGDYSGMSGMSGGYLPTSRGQPQGGLLGGREYRAVQEAQPQYYEAVPRRGMGGGGYDESGYGGQGGGYGVADYYSRGGGYGTEQPYVIEEVAKRPSSMKGRMSSMSGSVQRGFGRMLKSEPMVQRGTEKKMEGKAQVFASKHPGTAAVVEKPTDLYAPAAAAPVKERVVYFEPPLTTAGERHLNVVGEPSGARLQPTSTTTTQPVSSGGEFLETEAYERAQPLSQSQSLQQPTSKTYTVVPSNQSRQQVGEGSGVSGWGEGLSGQQQQQGQFRGAGQGNVVVTEVSAVQYEAMNE